LFYHLFSDWVFVLFWNLFFLDNTLYQEKIISLRIFVPQELIFDLLIFFWE
jgi:hypothetical protein